jgi:hypothetical protein
MAKAIKLTKGKFALVDEEDFEWLNQYKWRYHNGGYASRDVRVNGKRTTQRMHRLIIGLETSNDLQVDHIDGDGLNNCKENLRLCTCKENPRNQKRYITNITGYRGVSYHSRDGKYQAQISHEGKRKGLGYFDTAEEASIAYEAESKRLRGEFHRDAQHA